MVSRTLEIDCWGSAEEQADVVPGLGVFEGGNLLGGRIGGGGGSFEQCAKPQAAGYSLDWVRSSVSWRVIGPGRSWPMELRSMRQTGMICMIEFVRNTSSASSKSLIVSAVRRKDKFWTDDGKFDHSRARDTGKHATRGIWNNVADFLVL